MTVTFQLVDGGHVPACVWGSRYGIWMKVVLMAISTAGPTPSKSPKSLCISGYALHMGVPPLCSLFVYMYPCIPSVVPDRFMNKEAGITLHLSNLYIAPLHSFAFTFHNERSRWRVDPLDPQDRKIMGFDFRSWGFKASEWFHDVP